MAPPLLRSETSLSQNSRPTAAINRRVRSLPVSATLAINELSHQLAASGQTIYKFGLGQSPFPVPPSVIKALQQAAGEKDYLPVAGLPALRDAVAQHISKTTETTVKADQIIVGPGSKELLFILQLAGSCELLLPNPSWVSYAPQARIIGRRARWLPCDPQNKWQIDLNALDTLCSKNPYKPRILCLNSPNNPHGYTYSRSHLAEIAEMARKHRLLVLSDEIYGELHHSGNHCSIAKFYPEGTIVSTGLSKWCGAGGWRLGVASLPAGHSDLLRSMLAIASETFTSVAAPIQYAGVTAFLGNGDIDTYLQHSRSILHMLGNYIAPRLRAFGADVVEPDGAFYLFPGFSAFRSRLAKKQIFTASELCQSILQDTGVAMLPGNAFGRPARELSLRLAYVDFDGARALRYFAEQKSADKGNSQLLQKIAPRCLEAISRLEAWFTAL